MAPCFAYHSPLSEEVTPQNRSINMAEGYPASSAEEPEVIDVAWSDDEGLVVLEIPENIKLGEN